LPRLTPAQLEQMEQLNPKSPGERQHAPDHDDKKPSDHHEK
jgi:hypothetical protein